MPYAFDFPASQSAADMQRPRPSEAQAHRRSETQIVRDLFYELLNEPQSAADMQHAWSRIAQAHRRPESQIVHDLLSELPRPTSAQRQQARMRAATLATHVRELRSTASGIDALMQEFSLDSAEGVALMCLAEALLRIPDTATRDALIRDKLREGDWQAHVGASPSLFVNAAAWGLMIAGTLTGTLANAHSTNTLANALTSLLRKGGEPLIRAATDHAMRMLGQQFVTGRTIEEALNNASERETRGYTFSYDMLGEAALTATDAARYCAAYEHAIHAIGHASNGRALDHAPGVSIKLSALHPRYERKQFARVRDELVPRVLRLAQIARGYNIGFNIDAEQAERLDLSMYVLAELCRDRSLDHWHGLGCVVQAYQKNARPLLTWIVGVARSTNRSIMVRLVKGAYWDSEIKYAQVQGYEHYPVFTRKAHTDLSYLACASILFAAGDAVYPQFATHNAHTIAAIEALAENTAYEFQCLHGMGESVYDQIVGSTASPRRCRIYAPVGPHETLLPYLVRRLLENGANSSFVNRIVDPNVSLDALLEDPEDAVMRTAGRMHARIPLPAYLLPGRMNSKGIDLADDAELAQLATALTACNTQYDSTPLLAHIIDFNARTPTPVRNPADQSDIVGTAIDATPDDVAHAIAAALTQGNVWSHTDAPTRAACLERAADAFEIERPRFIDLAVREAGKTLTNAVAEVREAVDFLRYYAAQARAECDAGEPESVPGAKRNAAPDNSLQLRAPIVAISPWNFPLAIFVGQIAAALAAGSPVLAKPAEQTPLIAHAAICVLHAAGVPRAALQLLPGNGETIGASLVADSRIRGVLFTGSTEVARLINRQLAMRDDDPILIAETGGQNAMIVDSSALPEQVVADALLSAFDSAGQRCSALRVLCLQDDIADTVLTMLIGAMNELRTGDPRQLATDVGPVIDAAARAALLAHVERMRSVALPIMQSSYSTDCANGTFVAPTVIDLGDIDGLRHLQGEVFGPLLHVLRWQRDELTTLIDRINATGYGLTHGIATRVDTTITTVLSRIRAGNVYVNRNIVGAVVGVQPFGGCGLSGTGPKAGGPFYLTRLMHKATPAIDLKPRALPGPTGETNTLQSLPRGIVACIADSDDALIAQGLAAYACGNSLQIQAKQLTPRVRNALRHTRIDVVERFDPLLVDAVLLNTDPQRASAVRMQCAATPGSILPVVIADANGDYDLTRLIVERTVTVNTAATGGNTALLSLDED